jgi:protein SCO1
MRVNRVLAPLLLLSLASFAQAEEEQSFDYANDETVGVEEKLGETIPLDLEFVDESGKTVTLGGLIDKPTILTLVYLRCPSICSPLMNEVAATVDKLDLQAGKDFQMLTVSFDVTDDPDLTRTAKRNLLERMEDEIPAESWRFLTGEAESISQLTDAVGFRYRRENDDFVHAASVIFLSPEGKIVRYLPGQRILPADMKMAIFDAAAGQPRTMMQKLQRLCYAYDSEGRSYALQVNRIILMITLPGILIFLGYLLFKKKSPATHS